MLRWGWRRFDLSFGDVECGKAVDLARLRLLRKRFGLVVPGEEVDLNSLTEVFQALEDWEYQLKHADIDFEELGL